MILFHKDGKRWTMFSYSITYECNGEIFSSNKKETPHFRIKDSFLQGRFTADMITKNDIRIKEFKVIFPYYYKKDSVVFINGYQSWTDSREYFTSEKMSGFSKWKKWMLTKPVNAHTGLCRSGDAFFCKYPKGRGEFFGYSYGYVRNDENIDLFASLSESSGYTIVRFDVKKSLVTAEKDFDGVLFSGDSRLIDFVHLNGGYDEVFDKWFEMMNIQCRQTEKKCGYTTWYNYYGNVDENIVKRDLKALSALPEKVDIFQIDDGYQRCIGEWLHNDEKKFPSGMKKLADEIHNNDMLAGLWLAPFAATKNSFIYKEHKDWLVHYDNGKLYPAGANWGGFYAIDFYNKDAAKYIRKVFDTILNDWGYDMVKLDFLYAACIVPMHNKSRGQIMCEAMDFIRDCVGDKLILGCGVPLMPSFGKVDFCRVGADVALEWKHNPYGIREDVSTPNTINCSIFRRGLNGRAFMNDPDVFLLRDNNIKMSFEQRKLVAEINSVFGSLLFVSDNVSQYSREQLEVFLDTIHKRDVKIIKAGICKNDIIRVEYLLNGSKKTLKFNYKNGTVI